MVRAVIQYRCPGTAVLDYLLIRSRYSAPLRGKRPPRVEFMKAIRSRSLPLAHRPKNGCDFAQFREKFGC